MLVVMLVLLTTTALAVFAIHTTTTEVRAAGYHRMSAQAQEVGESGVVAAHAWIDIFGPESLQAAMAGSTRIGGANPHRVPQPYEPALRLDQEGYRLYPTDFVQLMRTRPGAVDLDAPLMSPRDLGGTSRLYAPTVVVDVYDSYRFTGVLAGFRSDGHSLLRFLCATYTSRGRLRLTDATGAPVAEVPIEGDPQLFHEASSDARARGVSGPF